MSANLLAIPENPLHPSDDFVRRRVGGLVKVDDTRVDI